MDKFSVPVQWCCLILFAFGMTTVFGYLSIPAALLLGTMISATLLSIAGFSLIMPKRLFFFAQGVIGCMIAQRLSLPALHDFVMHWFLVLSVMVLTLCFSFFVGWILMCTKSMPGSTAIWGASPGAASIMVFMAMECQTADARLVAFMQYYRVLIVSGIAIIISHYLLLHHEMEGQSSIAQTLINWQPMSWRFIITLLVIFCAARLAKVLRVPSANLLGPLLVVVFLQDMLHVEIELPHWLLAFAYIIIGFGVGVRFTRPVVKLALRALPQITLAIVTLVLFCMGLAWLLMTLLDIDFFSAYLATSPGGMDAIAIIAANAPVEMSLIMTVQTTRLLITIVLSPIIANRLIRNRE